MAKYYQVKKTINGKEYTAQFNGISAALDAVDNSYVEDTGNTSLAKMSKYVFDNVIVIPKNLTPDDFDNMREFSEVVAFGREVMQGNIKPDEDKKADK